MERDWSRQGALKTALKMYKKAFAIATSQQEETVVVFQKNIDRVTDKLKRNE